MLLVFIAPTWIQFAIVGCDSSVLMLRHPHRVPHCRETVDRLHAQATDFADLQYLQPGPWDSHACVWVHIKIASARQTGRHGSVPDALRPHDLTHSNCNATTLLGGSTQEYPTSNLFQLHRRRRLHRPSCPRAQLLECESAHAIWCAPSIDRQRHAHCGHCSCACPDLFPVPQIRSQRHIDSASFATIAQTSYP